MKCIVIGTTRLAFDCAKLISAYASVSLIENADSQKNILIENECNRLQINNLRMDKRSMMEYLSDIREKTYIFSVKNYYLFPKCVVNNKNLIILNSHSALLPRHPGRNAEAWAIYDGDGETGVTWHYINEDVDAGYMIAQRSLKILKDDTAGQLFVKLLTLSYSCLKDILPQILSDTAPKIKLTTNPADIKLLTDIPNDGVFNTDCGFDQASQFLRSIDYGIYPQFPPPKLCINGIWYTWKRSRLTKCDTGELKPRYEINRDSIQIIYPQGIVSLRKAVAITSEIFTKQ